MKSWNISPIRQAGNIEMATFNTGPSPPEPMMRIQNKLKFFSVNNQYGQNKHQLNKNIKRSRNVPSNPSICPTIIICPVEDTGIYSVRPSTMPTTTAQKYSYTMIIPQNYNDWFDCLVY